jgi:hypothetical protein
MFQLGILMDCYLFPEGNRNQLDKDQVQHFEYMYTLVGKHNTLMLEYD